MNGFAKGFGPKKSALSELLVGRGASPAIVSVQNGSTEENRLWARDSETPTPPPGFLFPVEAFDRAGRALWGDEWTGLEMLLARIPLKPLLELPSSCFPDGIMDQATANAHGLSYLFAKQVIDLLPEYEMQLAPMTVGLGVRECDYNLVRAENDHLRERWVACRVRWKDTIAKLCGQIALGVIATVYRPKKGGAPQTMPAEWWQIDSYYARLRTCGINPSDPFDPDAERTDWFFVHAGDLARELTAGGAGVAEQSMQSPLVDQDVHLSPYIRLMIEVAHVTGIGPEPQQQIEKDALIQYLRDAAGRKSFQLTDKEAGMMATFLREPYAKAGLKKVKADQRANSGSAPN